MTRARRIRFAIGLVVDLATGVSPMGCKKAANGRRRAIINSNWCNAGKLDPASEGWCGRGDNRR